MSVAYTETMNGKMTK